MRHLKNTCKLNRTSSHRRCMFANMLKSIITHGRIQTTVPKAKALRSHAEKLVTLAKKGTLAANRQAIAQMMVRYNSLSSKQEREAKEGNLSSYNDDRLVMEKLADLGKRFASRNGGYTRIVKGNKRVGDNAQTCVIEFLAD